MVITSRFRRDVLEGTIEELLPDGEEGSQGRSTNVTVGGKVKRQTSIPGPGDHNLDKSRFVVRSLNFYIDQSTMLSTQGQYYSRHLNNQWITGQRQCVQAGIGRAYPTSRQMCENS